MDVKGIGVTLPTEMSFIVNTVLGFLVKIVYSARILKVQQKTHVNQRRTKMTEQEKYLEGHRNCGIKVGDRVRVTRKAESRESGWDNWRADDCAGEMDAAIGREGEVVADLDDYGFGIEIEDCVASGYAYPYFVLEKI